MKKQLHEMYCFLPVFLLDPIAPHSRVLTALMDLSPARVPSLPGQVICTGVVEEGVFIAFGHRT